ncbi:MAG: ABC transporter ATP-binding protein [Bradyrhizobium sp.]
MQTVGAEKLLEIRIDSKAYGSGTDAAVEILRDTALRLDVGSFVSLFGPSGCGKTSILRIAAGLDRDFHGERWIAHSARVGMVFQEPRLFAWRTVEDNIRIAMEAASATGDIGGWLERFDLVAQRRQYAGELSLGQARRVAMVRALSIAPNLLLLDEPLVSLDQTVAALARSELRALADSGKVGILLVTHDLEEAVGLSDRVLFLGERGGLLEKDISVPRNLRDPSSTSALAQELAAIVAQTK